jgi:predicted nucleotidyltransferase
MPIPNTYLTLAQEIAERFRSYEEVEAIAISGSLASGRATELSDMDLYIYLTRDLTVEQRREMVVPYASQWQHVDYWGPADVFFDARSGLEVELIQFKVDWMTDQITRALDRHEPSMGYSTAFWHTIRQSHIVYDRNQWLTSLKTKAQQSYPPQLARNIVAYNYPLLNGLIPSYRNQLKSAIVRQDLLSINHGIADFFNSYFDILFAVNHQPHPGQKRRLENAQRLCQTLPQAMPEDVTRVLQGAAMPDENLLHAVDMLLAHLAEWLTREGYSIA